MGTGILIIQRIFQFLSMVVHRIIALITHDNRLHKARFATTYELRQLLSSSVVSDGLLLGTRKGRDAVCVRPTKRGKNLAICLLLRQPEAAKGCSQPVNSCPGTTQWLSMTSKATSLPKPQDIEQHSATCLSLTQPE